MTSVEAYWAALQGAPPAPRSRSRAGPMLGWAATSLVVAGLLVLMLALPWLSPNRRSRALAKESGSSTLLP